MSVGCAFESLHVTLKFIGEWPNHEEIRGDSSDLSKIASPSLSKYAFRGYGFFPTPKSATGILDRNRGAVRSWHRLAKSVDREPCYALGIRRDESSVLARI